MIEEKPDLRKPLSQKRISPTRKPPQEETVKVALFLPLTGQHAALGRAMKGAAEQSLFENADESLELVIKDTAGTAEGAQAALKSLGENPVQAILGPVFSYEARAIASNVRTKQLPVFSFSSDRSVAGRGIYILGFSPSEQARRVVLFAKSKGFERIAAIVPKTAYGKLISDELRSLFNQRQITLVGLVEYMGNGENIGPDLETLKSVPFDALLLPVAGTELAQLRQNLIYHDFDMNAVKLLGTGVWDNPDASSDPSLQGAWFAASDPQERADFENDHKKLYASSPERISTLAYDAVSLAAALIREDRLNPFKASSVVHDRGFAGIDGVFRLRSNGTTERGLSVLEIASDGSRVVSPAPDRF